MKLYLPSQPNKAIRLMLGQSFMMSLSAVSLTTVVTAAQIFVFGLALVGSAGVLHAQGKAPSYMGTATCSSSNCHGSVSPRKENKVLQNEYVTWQKHDLHSKAWVNLTNQDSKTIAKHLGISAPEKDPLCLNCHATHVDPSRHGEKFDVKDGVSCESCHGPAENYLSTHTGNGTTHTDNLKNGLADLASPEKRASLCLSCHYGTDDKTVNHRLIGAGHPRLSFELDTFGMIQPRHWLVDADYRERKGDYSSAKAWLLGQVEISEGALKALLSEKRARAGAFPELTLFYCYSCHHSLVEDQWKSREYGGRPGELRLNTSSLIVIGEALKVLSPKVASKLSDNLEELHSAYYNGNHQSVAEVMLKNLSEARAVIRERALSDTELTQLLKATVSLGGDGALQYEVAEQLAMGMSAIIASKSADGTLYKAELDAVYDSLKNPEAFAAQAFMEACNKFQGRI